MSRMEYQNLVQSQLTEDTYCKVSSFPFQIIIDQIGRIVDYCGLPADRKTIIMDIAMKHDKPAPFYILPKIHKPAIKTRPITVQHSYVLGHLSTQLACKASLHRQA